MHRMLGAGTLIVGLACAVGESATPHRASLPQSGPETFGIGRPATADEIAAWDIDIMPDGTGLPPGSGTAVEGGALYAAQCASCHGPTGVEGPFNVLVGRVDGDAFPFGNNPSVRSTIGNYWPYATTVYDYINRTMPFEARGNLQADEVYGLVAALLHMNGIIGVDEVMNAETLPRVRMPARDRFVRDDRAGGAQIR